MTSLSDTIQQGIYCVGDSLTTFLTYLCILYQITRMFSSSKDVADGASFSVSGPLPLISFDRRETVLTRSCPELKLLLPSLHEPACFGEFLSPGDVNKCRESICCLNNTKKKSC